MPSPFLSKLLTRLSTSSSVRGVPSPGTGRHRMALSSSGDRCPSPLVSYSAMAARISSRLGIPPRNRPNLTAKLN
eukprot:scaffold24952_cov66-Phaeocystis_antarctica.AAC.6